MAPVPDHQVTRHPGESRDGSRSDRRGLSARAFTTFLASALFLAAPAQAGQEELAISTASDGPALQFDWPTLEIGVGTYEAGPTGLTVFRFPRRALVAVDVRGGAPGTANTDMLRLGYDSSFVDAVVFAGGSAYGEEAIAAVGTGLKEAGARGGAWDNVGIVTGAVVYDFSGHRLNEIYPDKRLAHAALAATRPGLFPQGAAGAGRSVMQGWYFGCGAHSGQGGAFRQIGEVKIAAFTVVNALGSVTDRDGRLVKCAPIPGWTVTKTAELLARVPLGPPPTPAADADAPTRRNTTLSLVVTNRKMGPAALQRLAVQVHGAMARAIQPFNTFDDGDTLFAVTTGEVAESSLRLIDLDTIAGELMWDAVLASIPAEPRFEPQTVSVAPERLAAYPGTYDFGPRAEIKVTLDGDHLFAEKSFPPIFFDLRPGQRIRLEALSETEFYVAGRYRTRLSFQLGTDGKVAGAIVDAGPWQQAGRRVGD